MSSRPWVLFDSTVAKVEQVTPNLRRVTLTGPDLVGLADPGADTRIKLLLTEHPASYDVLLAAEDWFATLRGMDEARRPTVRTYTLAAWRAEGPSGAPEVDVLFALHDPAVAGPATRWAMSTSPGDRMVVVGPSRDSSADPGGREFFPNAVGTSPVHLQADHCALPALQRILAELPPETTGTAIIDVPTPADQLALTAPTGVSVVWRTASGHSELRPDTDELLWEVDEADARRVWVAGEASAVRDIRRGLARTGMPRGAGAFMGYWRAGRSES